MPRALLLHWRTYNHYGHARRLRLSTGGQPTTAATKRLAPPPTQPLPTYRSHHVLLPGNSSLQRQNAGWTVPRNGTPPTERAPPTLRPARSGNGRHDHVRTGTLQLGHVGGPHIHATTSLLRMASHAPLGTLAAQKQSEKQYLVLAQNRALQPPVQASAQAAPQALARRCNTTRAAGPHQTGRPGCVGTAQALTRGRPHARNKTGATRRPAATGHLLPGGAVTSHCSRSCSPQCRWTPCEPRPSHAPHRNSSSCSPSSRTPPP